LHSPLLNFPLSAWRAIALELERDFVCQQRSHLSHSFTVALSSQNFPEQRRATHSRHHSIHDAIQRQSGIMKYNILTATALAFSTLASSAQLNVHGLEDLVPRDIDPKTMDPTRLSVLSVLRTAIPSGTDFPKPSGDFEPDWYKNLPADVKSLLPSLYPVTITSTSTSTSTATVHVSAAASTPTSVVSYLTPSASAAIAVLGPPLTRSE
jgi:hypothetical protein